MKPKRQNLKSKSQIIFKSSPFSPEIIPEEEIILPKARLSCSMENEKG